MIHLEWCSVHVGPQQKLVERMNEGRKCDNLGRGLQSKKALEPRKGGLLAWLGVVDISAVRCAMGRPPAPGNSPLVCLWDYLLPPPVHMDLLG